MGDVKMRLPVLFKRTTLPEDVSLGIVYFPPMSSSQHLFSYKCKLPVLQINSKKYGLIQEFTGLFLWYLCPH